MRRDIDRLRALGYPVEAVMGPDGGYRLVAGTAMPPLLLDDGEAVAIAIGLRIAAGQAVTGIEETSVRALAKLEQVLPKRLRRRVATIGAATVPFTLRNDPSVDPDLLTRLAGLIKNSERLRFGYVAADGSSTDRNVEPRSLVAQSGRYLLGYDLDRDDWRTFRADRIGTLRPTGHRFRPRPLPAESVEALVRRQVYARAQVFRAEVSLAAPIDRVSRLFGNRDGLTEEDGGCRYVSHEDTVEFLAFRLFRLDCEFEVHQPTELINFLRRLGERALRAARSGPTRG